MTKRGGLKIPRVLFYNDGVNPKQIAAERAVSYIQDGMVVGLGTGSTAAYAVLALGERLKAEPLRLRCVATSQATMELARAQNIPLTDWADVRRLDMTIDGADEVDPQFRLIKGGGGALLREKLVAALTETEIIVVDATKAVSALGAHALPVVIVPFAWQTTQARLVERFGVPAPPRLGPDGRFFVSDDGGYILDLAFGAPLPSPDTLEDEIKRIVGVMESGLFLGHCQRLIIGHPDGRIEENVPPAQ